MSQRRPLHDEDEKMLKILACKKLMCLQTGCKNVYNGVHIYTDVKKYIYIYMKKLVTRG
jgi:hypothetical protein